MKKLNKILATGIAVAGVVCMTVTAYAYTSKTFTVNNVPITASLSHVDTDDTSPVLRDSVTATTSSSSVMDSLTAEATIYYSEILGTTLKTVTDGNSEANAKKCSVTVYESRTGVGYRGEGTHKASHAKKSGSCNTVETW